MILPGVELKIFDLGVGELPPGLTLNRGGKMTKISSWGGKFFFSLAVLKSCPCMVSQNVCVFSQNGLIMKRIFSTI